MEGLQGFLAGSVLFSVLWTGILTAMIKKAYTDGHIDGQLANSSEALLRMQEIVKCCLYHDDRTPAGEARRIAQTYLNEHGG